MNKFNWNLRYSPARRFDGMVLWAADMSGPMAIPGDYRVELNYNDTIQSRAFTIRKDPRSPATPESYKQYHDFASEVRDKITEAHQAIIDIRDIRAQLSNYKTRISDDSLKTEINKIDSSITKIEEALYQTKNRSSQDPLNYPVRLTNKIGYLNSILGNGEYPPTDQAYAVRSELEALIDEELKRFEQAKTEMIPAFNRMVREKEIDAIILKE
jgi:hypothetical protein